MNLSLEQREGTIDVISPLFNALILVVVRIKLVSCYFSLLQVGGVVIVLHLQKLL